MRISGAMSLRAAAVSAAALVLLTACGGGGDGDGDKGGQGKQALRGGESVSDPTKIPDVGKTLQSRIPDEAGQVVAVYGKGVNSTEATVVLYTKRGKVWDRTRSWAGHNGKRGWTPHHQQGDKRSPIGVYALSDAGGVLPDPGARLPYTSSGSFAAPHYWPKSHWTDFNYVIAIDYNRVKGTSPLDPTRPEGQQKGGSIWLHMDHGSGTSGCVSLSKSGMEYLLKNLDPKRHPVVVMGDKAHLAA